MLFGSVARGTSHDLSDFDFYIVTKKNQEKDRYKLMMKFNKNCDIILRCEKDLEKYLYNLSALDVEVFSEGIVIYGKGVLTEKKKVLLRRRRKR